MNKALDKKLCEKYPQIFRDHNEDMTKTAMCWGFECDDGWFGILDDLCTEIMEICARWGDRVPCATQVKEKYGGLRFYTDGTSRRIYKAISKAEEKSESTCEECGEKGTQVTDKMVYWIKTLCDKCAKKDPRWEHASIA